MEAIIAWWAPWDGAVPNAPSTHAGQPGWVARPPIWGCPQLHPHRLLVLAEEGTKPCAGHIGGAATAPHGCGPQATQDKVQVAFAWTLGWPGAGLRGCTGHIIGWHRARWGGTVHSWEPGRGR